MASDGLYRLIDSGDGRKLEDLGGILVERQASAALWRRDRAQPWNDVHARHHRSERGGGHWEYLKEVPKEWSVRHGGSTFRFRLTPFGHIGLFPEQLDQWSWLETRASALERPKLLNLFAYTGGSTLAMAKGGARVCHVDAAKGVVDWARSNAAANQLDECPIRWIVDDCQAFLQREIRRDRRYDGVVLDPPSFGRGPKKEAFRIEDSLPPLLDALQELLGETPKLILLSCHSPGFTPVLMRNLLEERFDLRHLELEGGEMCTSEARGRRLPAGCYIRGASG